MAMQRQTRSATVVFREGIVINTCRDGAVEDAEDARANLEAIRLVAEQHGNVPAPVLVDLGGARAVQRDARAIYSSAEGSAVIKAAAILAPSVLARVIGTFFLGLNRPIMPVKLFTDRSEAIAWLQGYLP